MAAEGPGATDRLRLPGPPPPVRRLDRLGRARGRAAPDRPAGVRGRRSHRRPAGAAAPGPPRPGQPVHALRRRAASGLGRHGSGHATEAAGARRADLRSGRPDLGRAGGPAGRPAGRRRGAGDRDPRRGARRRPRGRRPDSPFRRRDDRGGRVTAVDLLAGAADTDRSAPLARANPVAKLAVSLAVSVALLLTVDVVTAGVALLLELACLPWCGLPARSLLRRSWIVLVAAVPAGVVTAWLGVDSGASVLALGPVTVTEGSVTAGAAITLRVLAIGLPGVVLLATTDPTDLADALAQLLHLPHRFVLAALAATRLVGVLAEEWQMLSLARRARGLGDDGWTGRLRTASGQVFALLVLSIRRATSRRSHGPPSPWRASSPGGS